MSLFLASGVVESDGVRARRWVVTLIGAVSGVCFAALAARSLGAMTLTPHFSRPLSLTYAAITAVLSYISFRAATAGRTDVASVLRALWGGFAGAAAGLVIVFASYLMFRDSVRVYICRPLALHLSQVTMFRLVLGFLCLGFAAGFALRIQKQENGRAGSAEDE
jgi:hypothetical protein